MSKLNGDIGEEKLPRRHSTGLFLNILYVTRKEDYKLFKQYLTYFLHLIFILYNILIILYNIYIKGTICRISQMFPTIQRNKQF